MTRQPGEFLPLLRGSLGDVHCSYPGHEGRVEINLIIECSMLVLMGTLRFVAIFFMCSTADNIGGLGRAALMLLRDSSTMRYDLRYWWL